MEVLKTCTKCKKEKPLSAFHFRKDRNGYRSDCRICFGLYDKRTRRNPDKRPMKICSESRKSDRKHGRLVADKDQLDIPFVQKLIANGCAYCGNKEMFMVADRIDNSRGHSKDNVMPCCERCNNIRRDMPYTAWEDHYVAAARAAYLSGAYGNWTGAIHKRKPLD